MAPDPWFDSRRAFAEAATWFVEVAVSAGGMWAQEALGVWSVRDLIGHTSRAMSTVEAYLAHPPVAVTVSTAVDYYHRARVAAGDAAAVAQRGRDAGAALGPDPAAAVSELAARVIAIVDAASPEAVVATPSGGMRLLDYLPTRTFELIVHTCDLAAAIGVVAVVPETAAAASLCLVGGLAAAGTGAAPLLLAATGRVGLPPGFTVL